MVLTQNPFGVPETPVSGPIPHANVKIISTFGNSHKTGCGVPTVVVPALGIATVAEAGCVNDIQIVAVPMLIKRTWNICGLAMLRLPLPASVTGVLCDVLATPLVVRMTELPIG